MIMRLGPGQRA